MIELTPTLYWFAPACALALWVTRGWLLPLAVASSVFQAASLINIRSGAQANGLAPAYILLVGALLQESLRPSRRTQSGRAASAFLSLFVAYAIVSAALSPLIFSGTRVIAPRVGMVTLTWSMSNVTQITYLLLCSGLFFAARRTNERDAETLLQWVLGGCTVSAVIGLYQWLAIALGLPFPSAALYSNTTYTLFDAYRLHQLWGVSARINATFAEPSFAALPYSGALAVLLARVLANRYRLWDAAAAMLILVALLLSASSTAYLCLAVIAVGGFIRYVRNWHGGPEFRLLKLALAGAFLGTLLSVVAVPTLRVRVTGVLQTTLFEKTKSGSYAERSQWNAAALETAQNTYYLGAGWGSSRASSFGATLLANVGVLGTGLFAGFVLTTMLLALLRERLGGRITDIGIFEGAAVTLLAHFLAVPDIVFPILWLYFGLAVRRVTPPELSAAPGEDPALNASYAAVA